MGRLPTFNCATCRPDMRRHRGCKRGFKRKVVWKIDECVFCGGKNKHCQYCHGKGSIPVRQCPRAVIGETSGLLPYYLDYRKSNGSVWPSGVTGRIYQPIKLCVSFGVLDYYYDKVMSDGKKN